MASRPNAAHLRATLARIALLGIGLGFAACRSSASQPRVRAGVNSSSHSMVQEPLSPAEAARNAAKTALLATLHPGPGAVTLRLGLRTQRLEPAGGLFGDTGAPVPPTGPGYRTLVIHLEAGAASLLEDLPYLEVPQPAGYLYVGDVTAHADETGSESQAELERIESGASVPRWYLTTHVWLSRDRRGIEALSRRMQASLARAREWGTVDQERVGYVTPRVLVLESETAQWSGGALAFSGSSTVEMEGLGNPIDTNVSARLGRDAIERIGQVIAERYELDPEARSGIDAPLNLPFGDSISLMTDTHLCLTREEGRVWEAGCVLLPGNSARSYTEAFRIRPAADDLAPSNFAPLEFAAVKRAWPDAGDVLVAPSQAVVLVLSDHGLSIVHVDSGQEVLNLGSVVGSIVMAEWELSDAIGAVQAPH
jgi:hypothetical protein